MNITIIGLGLIGGSLGLALKDHYGESISIVGVDSHEDTRVQALVCGAVDHAVADYQAGVAQADVVFLCTPVLQIVPIVQDIAVCLKAGAILSDVGSTKQYLHDALSALLPSGIHYVAGHPMTGSEQSGIWAANRDLFRDKWYILIGQAADLSPAVRKIWELLTGTGAKITVMELAEHDPCAAVISHVPHVAAAALVNLLGRNPDTLENNLKLAGGGFKDTTRIASSNADMWADICMSNPDAIVDSLEHLQHIIGQVADAIRQQDRPTVHDFFKTAKVCRDALIHVSFGEEELNR